MGRVARLRMPAYAKGLRDNRRRGFHPLAGVRLVYGDDWSLAKEALELEQRFFVRFGREAVPYGAAWPWPVLAIRPREFGPNVFDFSVVAGVPVTVIDGCSASHDYTFDETLQRVTRWGLFYDLLGEVAFYSSAVSVMGSVFTDGADVADLAGEYRGDGSWPSWWSDDLEARYRQANAGWVDDLGRIAVTAGGALGAR